MSKASNLLAAVGVILIVVCIASLFGVAIAGLFLGVVCLMSSWALHQQASRAAAPARVQRITDAKAAASASASAKKAA